MSDAFEEFGPYAVYERLGQGGMATVHRAEKRGVGIRRPIALKRLLPHVAIDPALVKLFVDEARLAAHLRHTNVAQTYELGKVGDTFFIAMEYASGPTLAQIMRQSLAATGDIPLPITVAILQQVCEALDYAHNLCDETGQSLRIIHRDVSPANIIVTNTGIVKLIDFGIAKATISSVKTQTGFIKGKFGYIAPEYITGKIDARVDLFAIGVVAHEMMTGRRLFEGKDDFETLQNIREMNPQPPSRWNRHVPPDLDDIVMTALQRDPADRWQSAGAMQVALANVARSFGRVVGNQQVAMWVDWAFSQRPGTDRAADSAHDTAAFQSEGTDPESSLSMEAVGADSVSSLRQPPDHGLLVHAAPDPDSSLSIEISGVPEVGEATLDGAEPTPQPATPVELTPQPATPVELTPQPATPPEPTPQPESVLRPEPVLRAEPAPRQTSRKEPSPRPELVARRQSSPRPELAARRQSSPRPELAARRQPSPPRLRGPSDSDETLPVERLTLTTGDIELLTPSPEIAPPPAMLQPPAPASPMPPAMALARSSRSHDAVPPPVAPPTAPAVAARPPSLAHPRPSRSIDAVVPPQPPTARASRTVDAVSPPPSMRPSRPFDAVLPPPTPPPQRRSRPMLPFAAPPTPPRASRIGDAVDPPLVPSPDGLDTLGTPPYVAASQELEVLARPPPRVPPSAAPPSAPPQPEGIPPAASSFELPVASSFELPVASSFELPAAPADEPAEQAAPPAPAAEVKRATRSRHKATQRTRPQPGAEPAPAATRAAPAATRPAPRATHTAGTAPGAAARAPRRRHDLLWLILLMIVLGAAATAAAYYWPELW